ncbi:hypothetical protein NX722_17920 [Endozoicomonas gorgoniicola]|uniref:Uncharacterized protein n=1 Tax=Endozoicomonas gorgoniicola TaxID=1234144 RepID=A0ABT3MYL2_9GAMM|nr:hypothetical protein [Endozoicomonas gorgoniicola]MCW7554465.1 hypothetical protein [Endozoicomonas gorgoniicola]
MNRTQFNSGLYKDFFGFDMGVVGDDSWTPNTKEEFLIKPGTYRYRIIVG